VFHDLDGHTKRAFVNTVHPDYYVLDDRGRIAFEHSTLADVERQLFVLQPTVMANRR
jgi:hypothetical protein